MIAPFPVRIVPLLPRFLQSRYAGMEHVPRAAEALGIDRAAFVRGVQLAVDAPEGATLEDLLFPYSVRRATVRGLLDAAATAGLVEERDGRYVATPRAHELWAGLTHASRAHLEALEPLPRGELASLAAALGAAFRAAAAAVPVVPHAHTPRAERYTVRGSDHPMVALNNAVFGLWMVRDDCHVAAWLPHALAGPDLDVLTRLWRGEAATADALASLLGHDTPEHVSGSLARLAARGLVEPGTMSLTAAGRSLRGSIEEETDRLFFDPWPADVGARSEWIRQGLERVVASLSGGG